MFSSACARLVRQAAGVLSAPSTKAYTTFSSHISACLSGSPGVFSLKVKLKRYARGESVSAIQNTFFYQTGDILPTKYCQMLANSTYFSYPAPWNLGLLQDSRHIIDKGCLTLGARAEMNQISILFATKNIFSDINAISPAINHLGIHLEIIWKTHLFGEGGCSSINVAPV